MDEEVAGLTRRTRAALAELPAVLGVLRESPAQNELSPNSFPSSYLSPTPSPDEMVIQQRGRKRIPVTWSPDINCKKQSPFQPNEITPQKGSSSQPLVKNGIVLRSTPKKRFLLSEFDKITTELKNLDPAESTTPTKITRNPSPSKSLLTPKRMKLDDKSSPIQPDNSVPLDIIAKGLSHDQLIEILTKIVEKHPEIEREVRNELPLPDLKPLEEKLKYLKHNIFRSLPTLRLVSKTDSTSYNRALVHTTSFKKALFEQGRVLADSQHWQSVVDYATMAWSYVKATPIWDYNAHNATRRQCFKFLVGLLTNALKKGQFDTQFMASLRSKLELMALDSDEVQSCIKMITAQS